MSAIGGDDLLTQVEAKWPKLGQLLRRYVYPAIEATAQNAGTSPNGTIAPPDAPEAVTVKASGEMVHVAITHNSPVLRNVRYFTEVSTNQSFSQPLVIDHGTSRTSHPFTLPTVDDQGNPQTYWFQSYAQYPGSLPSPKTRYGTGLQLGGYTSMSLLASRGSGTASPNGTQAGQGLGVDLIRLPLKANASSPGPGGGSSGTTPGQITGGPGLVLATPPSTSGTATLKPLTSVYLPVATTSLKGAVVPDGTTISINPVTGVISAIPGTGGISQLTGDVTAGPGVGSQAATVVRVNGAAVPISASLLGTNSSGQLVAATGSSSVAYRWSNIMAGG